MWLCVCGVFHDFSHVVCNRAGLCSKQQQLLQNDCNDQRASYLPTSLIRQIIIITLTTYIQKIANINIRHSIFTYMSLQIKDAYISTM